MRKNNLLKKTAWIVLSAVLFGTVAGTVMTGIQIASSGMVSQFFAIVASDEDTVKAEGEALPPPEPFPGEKIPETFPQAADIPAPHKTGFRLRKTSCIRNPESGKRLCWQLPQPLAFLFYDL